MIRKFVSQAFKKKAREKAAQKISKINKSDMSKMISAYKKNMNALRAVNKPAVEEYKKKRQPILDRIKQKGYESREDSKDLQKLSSELDSKLFGRISRKDIAKSLPDVRTRFRPKPGPDRKITRGAKNWLERNERLYDAKFKKKK